jgi:DNA-directed RNA polymerase specialized sigma subunit
MVLVHLEGKSQNEAAELLSVSKGQLSKLHTKALAELEKRDWEVPHD